VGVPVVDDDGVGGCEVDAEATRLRGEEEAEAVRVALKFIHTKGKRRMERRGGGGRRVTC
jgi:hypothetical protein